MKKYKALSKEFYKFIYRYRCNFTFLFFFMFSFPLKTCIKTETVYSLDGNYFVKDSDFPQLYKVGDFKLKEIKLNLALLTA